MTEFSVTSAYIRKDPQLHMPRICVFTCLFPDCKTHFKAFFGEQKCLEFVHLCQHSVLPLAPFSPHFPLLSPQAASFAGSHQ